MTFMCDCSARGNMSQFKSEVLNVRFNIYCQYETYAPCTYNKGDM